MLKRLWPILVVSAALSAADDNPSEILKTIGNQVIAQVTKSENYTCQEALTRFYYVTPTPALVCHQPPQAPAVPLYMQDRLRLDVAVSEASEIYSWHGENKFSSGSIAEVVQNGPISSGGFVGYLRNIFGVGGVQFTYQGKSTVSAGQEVYSFAYSIPFDISHYRVRTASGLRIIPFHGSFTAHVTSLQLASLTVIGDAIPPDSEICAIQTDISYQIAKISGYDSLIPAAFAMKTDASGGLYTESTAQYSNCKEFRGESTVSFDAVEESSPETPASQAVETSTIPSGLALRIALRTEIDDKTAYAGEPIEGVLARPAKITNGVVLAVGTPVHGLLTRFEIHYQPFIHYYLKLEFDRIATPRKIYSFRARHLPLFSEWQEVEFVFGRYIPPSVQQELNQGVIVRGSAHLHLDKHFVADYVIQDRSPSQ